MLINDWRIYKGKSACCQSCALVHSTINSRVCGAYIVCIFLCDEEILTEEFHLINSIVHLQYKFIEYDVRVCVSGGREWKPLIK